MKYIDLYRYILTWYETTMSSRISIISSRFILSTLTGTSFSTAILLRTTPVRESSISSFYIHRISPTKSTKSTLSFFSGIPILQIGRTRKKKITFANMVYFPTLSCGSIPLVLLAVASIVTATAAPAPQYGYGRPLNPTTPLLQECVAANCRWSYLFTHTEVGIQIDNCDVTKGPGAQ